jgi:CrcB protein
MSPLVWIGVATLGGVGALTRFLVDTVVTTASSQDFPLGTLTINVTGAFLLGLVSGLLFTGAALTLAAGATLGSYTTFSTWMLETQRLREDGEFLPAAANVVVSLALGVGAVALGRWLGSHVCWLGVSGAPPG